MFINPKIAIENNWIRGITNYEKQVQPNAIDFTLDMVFDIRHTEFIISEEGKIMRSTAEHYSIEDRKTGMWFWHLNIGVYDGMSNVYVNIPEGVAALLIVRSVFNRNGIFITSGLYDSGFNGHIGFAIHNRIGPAKIATGTRIGQIIFVKSENALMYAGNWNHEQGTHYSEKKEN
jgi:deoxycytidine triphosphate deaminase